MYCPKCKHKMTYNEWWDEFMDEDGNYDAYAEIYWECGECFRKIDSWDDAYEEPEE